jgi:predicted AAA+ superfamily ATPase
VGTLRVGSGRHALSDDRPRRGTAFSELYHVQASEFPPECRSADYEKRIQAAYPIHPDVFDRLYSDWSTLVKFQRTRGVLRLMAAVIHCLWEKGDRNLLILPSTIPIDDARVQFELTRYLSDAWAPIHRAGRRRPELAAGPDRQRAA